MFSVEICKTTHERCQLLVEGLGFIEIVKGLGAKNVLTEAF